MKPIVIRGRVTQVGEDDLGRPAAWLDSDGAISKLHVSRTQCALLGALLYGPEVEVEIRVVEPTTGG